MITRIVKMTFRPGTEADFQQVFRDSQPVIKTFAGCIDVNGFADVANPQVYFTISQWQSEEALNNYRNSEFLSKHGLRQRRCLKAKQRLGR
ncbi:MAG: antibiotic biosynthesis monooxygenase [Sphingobacteriales bacterium JAD_PAG50586_3]|nr:MAG: antibiotic biosynthesis monooxygenase [Sphingobacteriales bacterium JAD_PAG50586_3]